MADETKRTDDKAIPEDLQAVLARLQSVEEKQAAIQGKAAEDARPKFSTDVQPPNVEGLKPEEAAAAWQQYADDQAQVNFILSTAAAQGLSPDDFAGVQFASRTEVLHHAEILKLRSERARLEGLLQAQGVTVEEIQQRVQATAPGVQGRSGEQIPTPPAVQRPDEVTKQLAKATELYKRKDYGQAAVTALDAIHRDPTKVLTRHPRDTDNAPGTT